MIALTTMTAMMSPNLEPRRPLLLLALVALLYVRASNSLGTDEKATESGDGGDNLPLAEAVKVGSDHWPPAEPASSDGDHQRPGEGDGDLWRPEGEGGWTLRAPDPTQAVELEGSNVCTKQET